MVDRDTATRFIAERYGLSAAGSVADLGGGDWSRVFSFCLDGRDLVERAGHLIYNTAALAGPGGGLIGTYRKVALPRDEIKAGIAPGDDYPVFQTRFGKLGMMICYDGFFPEVARELTNRGAEVIAWPVWGCNPLLAAARACENHVNLVSSTYEATESRWMVSAEMPPAAGNGRTVGPRFACPGDVDIGTTITDLHSGA